MIGRVPGAKADFYVSFDNEGIGKAIADSLVEKLKAMGAKVEEGTGVLQINGSPVDAAAGLIKKGIHAGLDTSGFPILAEYDTPDWAPPKAQQWASGQITRFPGKILGVVAANDGTGGGAIAAFKAAGVDPVPPVTGNDATIAALQLIISGDQYNTISKPSEIVAAAAANVAVKFLKGETPEPKTTLYDTPSELFVPAVVTRENLEEPRSSTRRSRPPRNCAPVVMPTAAKSSASRSRPCMQVSGRASRRPDPVSSSLRQPSNGGQTHGRTRPSCRGRGCSQSTQHFEAFWRGAGAD